MASKAHAFDVGDYVVYPKHGVGRVIELQEQEIAGMTLELYVLRFEKERMTLRVPTNKVEAIGMRKLSSDKTLREALDTLKGKPKVKRTMWSRRAQEYDAKINSGDIMAVAEVVRDLYRSERQPEQSYSERQLFEQALLRMAREFIAAGLPCEHLEVEGDGRHFFATIVSAEFEGQRTLQRQRRVAQVAAQRLAEKLFGPALLEVRKAADDNQYVTRWDLTADAEAWASCDESGDVLIDSVIPPLNTGLARGPRRALQLVLATVLGRLGDDDKAPLRVPGVVEAFTRDDKDLAIAAWLRKHYGRNGKRGSLSVMFATTVVRAQL